MKKIEAIISSFKLDNVKEALEKQKICRMTISEVKGGGSQQATTNVYRGAEYLQDVSAVKVELIAADDEARLIAGLIATTLRTGELCNGEITVVPIEDYTQVRVGRRS
jgi:nitrogen regulatory protein PII